MTGAIAARALALATLAVVVAGCQSADERTGAMQAASFQRVPPDGRSGQRLGPDGYPLLGAYPNAAAPQLSDATVKAGLSRAEAIAARRKGATSSRSYQAEIARLKRLRRQQLAEVKKVMAQKPSTTQTNVGTKAKPSQSPDEVLRQIESGQ
ncbi:hypothetical protein LQ948_08415 [Jiella sp. MQZ9-1]|uniref:Beta-barrel assembly complex subunit BamF n=1 Tax=Jiella flava TaxID=2816857 RepID=A0A939JU48_9HYPH|nr:hypothetical protein [Jiella flava]MBO0662810.1 hypothetical protein [Jiella flava]MCD2471231.1 hypothetical protein [Jiella flava]